MTPQQLQMLTDFLKVKSQAHMGAGGAVPMGEDADPTDEAMEPESAPADVEMPPPTAADPREAISRLLSGADEAQPHGAQDIALPPDNRTPLDSNRLPESSQMPQGGVGRPRLSQVAPEPEPVAPPRVAPTGPAPIVRTGEFSARNTPEPTRPPSLQSPEAAVLSLMSTGGAEQDPNAGDPNAAIQLRGLREDRAGELRDRQLRGLQTGDRDAIYAGGKLQDLEGEMANDPFTGTAEHERVQNTKDTIDKAMLAEQQPMRGQREHAERYGIEKLTAGPAVKAQGDIEVERLRGDTMRDVASIHAKGLMDAAMGKLKASGAKLNVQEQGLVDAAHGMSKLGLPLLAEMEAKYPGIATNSKPFGSVGDALTAKFGKGFYSFGAMSDNDPILQKAATLQAWGLRSLAMGRINERMMDILNTHLPQPGYSAGANYDRLKRLLTDILPAQLEGIAEGHKPFDVNDPLANYGQKPALPPGYDPNDPSTWELEQ